ncbi:unnamed protein product [Angiostrongylus costaricensis]|uniref:Uncharacterized protein n=1 Tax=Angiostrongylus costaricensis TaxID=334426 RepID=A0A158PE93_ANGCS|nr:unnamed protein product [Angiostrongylus costaricensis]
MVLFFPIFKMFLDLCDIGGSFRRPSTYDFPALENGRRVYTFPTLHRGQLVLPSTFLGETVVKMDPLAEKKLNVIRPHYAEYLTEHYFVRALVCSIVSVVRYVFSVCFVYVMTQFKVPMEAPPHATPISIQLAPRLLTIRRKKMKKHKRRKRYDRDFFKYQKYHREKKLRSFEAEKYVEDTIATAKKEWSDELAPTGRKLYPHWSRLMSLEELYGLPKSDYIDKKAGFPSEEDMERIKKLKMEYENKFRGV